MEILGRVFNPGRIAAQEFLFFERRPSAGNESLKAHLIKLIFLENLEMAGTQEIKKKKWGKNERKGKKEKLVRYRRLMAQFYQSGEFKLHEATI